MEKIDKKESSINPESLRHSLPNRPGVYFFAERSGKVIYVGKAKNLKKRVLSYFRQSSELSPKTALMMTKAKNLDYIITSTENEAFILENSLIKKHKPRYNVVFRDDKQYPSLRLSVNEKYPRLNIVRRTRNDGALYFGPFSSSHSVRSTIKMIDRIFRLRKCRDKALPSRPRPCLNYQLNLCLGPCTGNIPEKDYVEIVRQVKLFLEGRNRELINQLKTDMKKASQNLNFEEAARLRDQIRAIEKTIEKQYVASSKMKDQDVIGLAKKGGAFQLVTLLFRRGHLQGSRNYRIKDEVDSPSEVIESFLKQNYQKEAFIPDQILISESINDIKPITSLLSELKGKKISIHQPVKGINRHLIHMAVTNAKNLLKTNKEQQNRELMEELKTTLKLKNIPRHIEGIDISNFQGGKAVGSIVCFKDGLPFKSGYRNLKIKDVEGIDDYGMMAELVRRRMKKENHPDLFLVDGGKGHLMVVMNVLNEFSHKPSPEAVAIAKAHEKGAGKTDRVFLPGRKNPVNLKKDSQVLFLLMRIRDEAHRRAITHHRKLRDKNMKRSLLDDIPGIGPKKKNLLLKKFGNIKAVSRATIEELEVIPGISNSLARNISSFFK